MRALGLLMILVGVVSFALPAYQQYMPSLPLAPNDLRLLGGALFILGGVTLWVTRQG